MYERIKAAASKMKRGDGAGVESIVERVRISSIHHAFGVDGRRFLCFEKQKDVEKGVLGGVQGGVVQTSGCLPPPAAMSQVGTYVTVVD
jgi:hypothetical protein